MTLLTEDRVRAAARRTTASLQKSYGTVLNEAAIEERETFDIFLSHSIKDAEIVVGTRSILRSFGYAVYVDWIVDKELDRTKVSPDTAKHLKIRMKQCASLLYLSTENSSGSKWMPWELGFFDGHSDGRVAILPVTKENRESYNGQEYLGIYPYVDAMEDQKGKEQLWVNRSRIAYGNFGMWLRSGPAAIRKRV